MPLTPIPELIRDARENHYALGYFESWNLESLQGVLDCAEETRSPIILGFNGEFLSRPGRKVPERLRCYAELGRAAASCASVPCGLIFNECPRDDWIREAIIAGFNLVMPADQKASYGDYSRRVKELTGYAHSHDVAVEAEIGELPCGVSGEADGKGQLTDPEIARRFVEETGIDLLAVSAGNVHVMVNGERDLDLDLLAEIYERISTPLVLHGGTGITASSLKRAIPLGVVKVNYGTYLKQRYISAISAAIGTETTNPHEVFGLGGDRDLMVAGRAAVREAVRERIGLLGCCGKAEK